ncbi:hypothetical protein ACFWA9_32910 [Kitasatospora sp. NPDC059973]|uniref:hypothetical protein n=1 Tax=Kitasatospora sp. NPDC059973 TaxID=3347020 RepID=UPI0036AB03F4
MRNTPLPGAGSLSRPALGRERIDILPDRTTPTLVAWLREHPGAEYVCRDGSGSYGEAIRQALPEAVQWHGPATHPP